VGIRDDGAVAFLSMAAHRKIAVATPLYGSRSHVRIAFDVTADGKRFLFNTIPITQSDSESITLVINWPAQLK
jgi:hypothetical protein